MVRWYSEAVDERAAVLTLPLVGATRRANERGVLHPRGGVRVATGFAEWLTEMRSCPPPANPA